MSTNISVGGLNNGLTAGMAYGVANGMAQVVNLYNRKVNSIAPQATFTPPYFELCFPAVWYYCIFFQKFESQFSRPKKGHMLMENGLNK